MSDQRKPKKSLNSETARPRRKPHRKVGFLLTVRDIKKYELASKISCECRCGVVHYLYKQHQQLHREREKAMRKALVIGTDDTIEVIDLDGPDGTLKILQNAVDGWVQVVDLNPKLSIWVNEEGKMHGLPVNKLATVMFQKVFGQVDIMVGNAVLTGGTDSEGETLGLTDEQVERFQIIFA